MGIDSKSGQPPEIPEAHQQQPGNAEGYERSQDTKGGGKDVLPESDLGIHPFNLQILMTRAWFVFRED